MSNFYPDLTNMNTNDNSPIYNFQNNQQNQQQQLGFEQNQNIHSGTQGQIQIQNPYLNTIQNQQNLYSGSFPQNQSSYSGTIQDQNQNHFFCGNENLMNGFDPSTIIQNKNGPSIPIQDIPVFINNQPVYQPNFISNLINSGSTTMIWDEKRNHSGIFLNVDGKVQHYYVHKGIWKGESVISCSGDVSAVYEPQRAHPAFFSKGQDGYLKYTYLSDSKKWNTSDIFQKAGKIGGRICAVFEHQRNHSACFFVGVDQKIHHYFVENGNWKYECFNEVPCTGDLSVVYELQRKSAAFVFESFGTLQYCYFNNGKWNRDDSSFKFSCDGAITTVYEKQRNHTAIYYATKQNSLVYYFVDPQKGWTSTANFFVAPVFGDIHAIYNDNTQHSEVIYTTKGGIEHYFVVKGFRGNEWRNRQHVVDCCSGICGIYQPQRKAIEFFFVTSKRKRNYMYFNGKSFAMSTNDDVKEWNN
eukprot:gene7797-12271_t